LSDVRGLYENLQLRTKLLLSLVLVTATLTGATLLVVRQSARSQSQREIEEDTHGAFLTIQAVQHQHELILGRSGPSPNARSKKTRTARFSPFRPFNTNTR
jgi:hypothetical protein